MSLLALKLVRDLWHSRWQYLAVGFTVMLGVTFYGAAYMSYGNLDASYRYSYDRLQFEDFGISFHAAPERVTERVRRIPGVKAVEGRLVEDVVIQIPGRSTKKLIGRLISIPADLRPAVNNLFIVTGRYLSGRTAREVLIESSFAKHHKLRPGDTIEIERAGARVRFQIAGIAMSPEYLYVVRSKQDLMPFPESFGVMFVSGDVLGPLVGKMGLVNHIVATITDPQRGPAIMREAKRLLDIYGAEEPVAREDQPSHQLLEQDLQGFQAYSVLFPFLFLSVAGLTVFTLLTRMVHMQRPVIGMLMATGFSRQKVVLHYLAAALLIGAMGSLLGSALGFWLSGWTTRGYTSFLSLPYVLLVPRWGALLVGFLIGTGVCLAAGVLPARAAARISPADALRGAVPATGRVVPLDRVIPGLGTMALAWRIPLRNVFRHPRRTVSTVFGVAAGISLIMVSQGLLDSSEEAMNRWIHDTLYDDIRVEFAIYQDRGVVNTVRSWPGVIWAEGALEMPVEFRKGDRTYSALLVGLENGSRLYRLRSESGEGMRPLDAGFLLGQVLRSKLGVEQGDTILVSLPRTRAEQEPVQRSVRVAGFVWESIGTVAYLPLDRMGRLFREDLPLPPGAITGVRVKVDPDYLAEVKERLLNLPGAGAVNVLADLRKMLDSMMALARNIFAIMLLFGMALAFSIVFNMITINVLERSSEVATMRTLGIGRWKILGMITLENMLTAAMGVCLGLPAGRWLVDAFIKAGSTEKQMELFSFKAVVYPRTYVMAAVAIVIVVLISQLPAISHVNRLNLARATKERVT
ncbi:MAG: FtsX-like permease family protein [bacterium]|nr:FtsX-like permease family protein [bacterium]